MRNIKNYVLLGFVFLIAVSAAVFAQQAVPYSFDNNYRNVRQIRFQLPFFNQPQLIDVEILDGKIIFQGDIVLGNEDELTIPRTRSAANYDSRWDKGVIPYVLSSSHPEFNDIKTAIDNLNNATNLSLIPRTNQDDYIEFDNTFGCASSVGKSGGRQIIHVKNCSMSGIMHEILHSAGFYHEQSRADRDKYITVNWENIEPGKEHNFKTYADKNESGTDIGSYDYISIMHYSPTAFSKNGKATISPKEIWQKIGGKGLSSGDMEGIRSMYPFKSDGIGMAYQLSGARVAANPQDKWALTMGDRILVITNDGRVFAHNIDTAIGGGYQLQSNQRVAANPQDKWVLAIGNRIVVITNDGRVFAHNINGNTVENAYQIPAPPVAANPLDKWVTTAGNRILVITSYGGVFAHDVGNVIGPGYQLRSNQKVAANAVDRWTFALGKAGGGHRIVVITNDGRVFAHDLNGNTVGDAYQLSGQKVAFNSVDKWVLPMHNRSDTNRFTMNNVMVITQNGSVFVHELDR